MGLSPVDRRALDDSGVGQRAHGGPKSYHHRMISQGHVQCQSAFGGYSPVSNEGRVEMTLGVDTIRRRLVEVGYQLCSHPAVVGRLQAVLGENLLLWASTLFNKRPGGDGIPWHQDTAYFDVEPPVTVTAWIALTEATVDNGCLQMIPGTHREHVPHIESESNSHFDLVAEPEYVPEKRALDIELSPGEAVLFNERVLHRSHPNTASSPRLGLSARVTVPFARINTDDPKILMTGTDEFGLNQLTEPPADSGSLD
ncbi:hypothetical protein BRC60_03970 [Halobacteriales archaeon QH_1_68_42]|nr:MAG: hypothetical protein BRC60_03970 [Halobacteriales archaeon QH_1_68_42]